MLTLLRLILPHHWVWACLSPRARLRQEALNQQPREWPPTTVEADELAALLPWIRGRVLEVGAGDGAVTVHLVAAGDTVTALEPDHQRVARGQTLAPAATWVSVRWAQWEARSYDRVVFTHTLHHLADRVAVARWVRERLVPGGYWLLLEPRHTWGRALRLTGKWLRYWWSEPWAVYGATHDFLTEGELRHLAATGPFRRVHADRCTHATLWVLQAR